MAIATSSPTVPSPSQEFWHGARDTLPLIVGAIPFGLIFGTLAQGSGLSGGAALAMSALVFAGSAQFIALGLLSAGSPVAILVLTTAVVNLRHLLYAASLVPYLQGVSQRWKLALGFWLTDECFMVAIRRYQQPDASPHKPWYQLGSALVMYANWQGCTLLGLMLGRQLPNAAAWGLDFAMVATFIGMVTPYLIHRPMGVSAIAAGTVSLLARGLPHQLGLMAAAIAGIGAGVLAEYCLSARQTPPA